MKKINNFYKKFPRDPKIDPEGYYRVVLTEKDDREYKVKYYNEKENKIMPDDWWWKYNLGKFLDLSLVYPINLPTKGTRFLFLKKDLEKINKIPSLDELGNYIELWYYNRWGKFVKAKKPRIINTCEYPRWSCKDFDFKNNKKRKEIIVHYAVTFFTVPQYTFIDEDEDEEKPKSKQLEADHKDRNKANCHPLNMRWASRSMNAKNRDVTGKVYYNITKNQAYFSKDGYRKIGSGIYMAKKRGIKYLDCDWEIFTENLYTSIDLKELLNLKDEDFIETRFYNSKPRLINTGGGGKKIYYHKNIPNLIRIGKLSENHYYTGGKQGPKIGYWDPWYDDSSSCFSHRLIAADKDNLRIYGEKWEGNHIDSNSLNSSPDNINVAKTKSDNMKNPATKIKLGRAVVILDLKKEICYSFLAYMRAADEIFNHRSLPSSISACSKGDRNYFTIKNSSFGENIKCKSMYEEDFLNYLSDLKSTNPELYTKLYTEYQNCKKSEYLRMGVKLKD